MGIKYLNLSSLDSFDNKGRKVCYIVSLYKKCQRQSCSAVNCLSGGINILAGGRPLTPEILAPSDLPLLKEASFDTFCLVAPQLQEIEKEVQLHLARAPYALSNEPSTKVLRCPQLPQNGDKLPKFVVFWTVSTIKDQKICCKVSLYKNCQWQSCSAVNCLSSEYQYIGRG